MGHSELGRDFLAETGVDGFSSPNLRFKVWAAEECVATIAEATGSAGAGGCPKAGPGGRGGARGLHFPMK